MGYPALLGIKKIFLGTRAGLGNFFDPQATSHVFLGKGGP
jgi:hypothetical protein